jgi:D-Tyr-tRNAtyr deacylase
MGISLRCCFPRDLKVSDLGLEVLCVSQFTLLGRLKGNKPDFSRAMPPHEVLDAAAEVIAAAAGVVVDSDTTAAAPVSAASYVTAFAIPAVAAACSRPD